MNRDRNIIARRLVEASELDPVAASRAVEEMASSSPPALTFAAAIADVLCGAPPSAMTGAFRDLLLDHVISLGPGALGQLQRVILTAESAPVVLAALERESVALSSRNDRFDRRLALALRGPGTEEVFGLLAQSAMARGHRWTIDAWEDWTTRTPPMRHAATRMVWAYGSAAPSTLRRTPEGELLDSEDEPVTLPDGELVYVPHPHDFPASQVERWNRVFAEYDIVSAFPQFSRTMAHIPESWAKRDAVPLHRRVDRNLALTHFVRSGWTLRRKGTRWYFDRLLRGPAVATISWHASNDIAHLIELYFASPVGAPMYLGDLDAVAYSEALLTLSGLG